MNEEAHFSDVGLQDEISTIRMNLMPDKALVFWSHRFYHNGRIDIFNSALRAEYIVGWGQEIELDLTGEGGLIRFPDGTKKRVRSPIELLNGRWNDQIRSVAIVHYPFRDEEFKRLNADRPRLNDIPG